MCFLGDAATTTHKHCCSPMSVNEQLITWVTPVYFGHSFTQSCKGRNSCVRFGHNLSTRAPADTEFYTCIYILYIYIYAYTICSLAWGDGQDPPAPGSSQRLYPDPVNNSVLGVDSVKWAESPCLPKAAHADMSPAKSLDYFSYSLQMFSSNIK